MLISLADGSPPSALLVGGKGASLAQLSNTPGLAQYVPKACALTVDFFQPWIKTIKESQEYKEVQEAHNNNEDSLRACCTKLKHLCQRLPLTPEQQTALGDLKAAMVGVPLVAVRSSAPVEDGTSASFAGAFDTKLGVSLKDNNSKLEEAVRGCFASLFDYRVVRYTKARNTKDTLVFAVVAMEMVDSVIAGVAFSANPINSDRDELVVDSSWGQGESVVDGTVPCDHYVMDKINRVILERTIGKKTLQKKVGGGGLESLPVEESRQLQSSLTNEQLQQLTDLVSLVEDTNHGMPMDVEWAYTTSDELKLLQARPITTLFCLDEIMMTQPGENRVLYYDYNIVSDATTTAPFTHMDMAYYAKLITLMMGVTTGDSLVPFDPKMPVFCGSTRQYMNLSMAFKFMSSESVSKFTESLDPYLAGILVSKDCCNREKYQKIKLPAAVSFRNAWWLCQQFDFWKLYKLYKLFKANPEQQKEVYLDILRQSMQDIQQLEFDKTKGLQRYADGLFEALLPSFFQELAAALFLVVPEFRTLDQQRREGKTEEIRSEYDALCGGYEGDELMEINKAMYSLANKLPAETWKEYEHKDLDKLADRIQENLDGHNKSDLPSEFLEEWNNFVECFGFDGQDQLFLSSPRYADSPVCLLGKLRQSIGSSVKDPAITQQEMVAKRRNVMELQEQRAMESWFLHPFALGKVQKRNSYLEHLFWIRNSPKMHLAKICGVLRAQVLRVQEELLADKRLEEKGDIFHLDLMEVDAALLDSTMDLMSIVAPRKAVYERAKRATVCPMIIDSRCRILKPDPPILSDDHEDGTLIGAAVSPGVARGRVRLMNNAAERLETGEVLATVVTSPAWTPLFVGASAIILQTGGVLQHGALCAREYGKPAVSNIDVHTTLETGMMVEVDGNTGVVRILSPADK